MIVAPGDDAGVTARRSAEHLRSHDRLPATVGAALRGRGGATPRTAYRGAAGTLTLLLALGLRALCDVGSTGIRRHMFVHQSLTD